MGGEEMSQYYSFDEIDRTGANWRIVFGERSNGKSYGSKMKMIQNFLKNGKQFAYIRRNVEEIKPKRVGVYFDDMLSDGYLEQTCRKHYGKEWKGFYVVAKTALSIFTASGMRTTRSSEKWAIISP